MSDIFRNNLVLSQSANIVYSVTKRNTVAVPYCPIVRYMHIAHTTIIIRTPTKPGTPNSVGRNTSETSAMVTMPGSAGTVRQKPIASRDTSISRDASRSRTTSAGES
jgi:hypothetical protein